MQEQFLRMCWGCCWWPIFMTHGPPNQILSTHSHNGNQVLWGIVGLLKSPRATKVYGAKSPIHTQNLEFGIRYTIHSNWRTGIGYWDSEIAMSQDILKMPDQLRYTDISLFRRLSLSLTPSYLWLQNWCIAHKKNVHGGIWLCEVILAIFRQWNSGLNPPVFKIAQWVKLRTSP